MIKYLFLILFLFVLVVPAASAFDCAYFSNQLALDCQSLSGVDEGLISSLIYTAHRQPDHAFVEAYNDKIGVTAPPEDAVRSSHGIIRNVWLSLLTISPSVDYNGTLYAPTTAIVRSEYAYSLILPSSSENNDKIDGRVCKQVYSLESKQESLDIYSGGKRVAGGKVASITIGGETQIASKLTVKAGLQNEEYRWQKYCASTRRGKCTRYDYKCSYYSTSHREDEVILNESRNVSLYKKFAFANFTLLNYYSESYRGKLQKSNNTNVLIEFDNASYREDSFIYDTEFSHRPFYFLTITAAPNKEITQANVLASNGSLYVKDPGRCKLDFYSFFDSGEKSCIFNISEDKLPEVKPKQFSENWSLAVKMSIFLLAVYLLYSFVKCYLSKVLLPVTTFLIIAPVARADDCGLTNLASCIPQKIYEFTIGIFNAPLQPLLGLVQNLLENSPNTLIFQEVWAVVTYVISMFYGLLFIYSGFQFILSGHDVIRREMAKEWLKNTVIMITLIQASFYLYNLVVDLSSVMTSAVITLVNQHFFLLTADNLVNFGLQFFFALFYVLVLLVTVLLLTIRYLVVAFGVIFVPIGIFCYFVPPLRSYGKLILNTLGTFIFITFIDSIIILACSMLIQIPMFENFKILVMICCFLIVNVLFFVLIKHVIGKSTVEDSGEKVAQAVKYIAMFA